MPEGPAADLAKPVEKNGARLWIPRLAFIKAALGEKRETYCVEGTTRVNGRRIHLVGTAITSEVAGNEFLSGRTFRPASKVRGKYKTVA